MASFAVLLILAPAALAGPTAAVTLKAPYKKATVTLTNPSSTAGCGTFTRVQASSFNKTTGIGAFSDNATTSWCTSYTNNSALSEGKFEVALPIKVTTTGAHTITVLWDTVAVGSENLTAGTCSGSSGVLYSGCTQFAKTFVYGYAFLLDKTTHKHVASSAWPGNFAYSSSYTSCRYTNCTTSTSGKATGSFGGSFFWAWYWNGTVMNSTHKYVLQMFILGGASVEMLVSGATLSGGSANAQLNSATHGNDEQLYSISIT
ncbi:MAG: hypothetical protein L3K19_06670 [Thermoplasmata archaeon]|nr:hypothetical protein [Thermoplasmata archaeon]